jgi:hypothetical protein
MEHAGGWRRIGRTPLGNPRMSNGQWRLLIAAVLAIVAGCVTLPSKIVPVGKDTYQLSMSGAGFAQANTKKALRTASEYCDKLGKHLGLQRNAESGVYGWSPRQSNLTFLCLDADDPGYAHGKTQASFAASP